MDLQTHRLILSEVQLSDLDKIHELHSMPQTDAFNTLGIPKTIEITKALVEEWLLSQTLIPRRHYIFSISLQKNEFIGLAGINMGKVNYKNAEIWYKINPGFWNKGYASEAVKALLEFCFKKLLLHRITAGCATGNLASKRVLEKAGMKLEGHHKKLLPVRGEWMDNYSFAILEEEFNHIL